MTNDLDGAKKASLSSESAPSNTGQLSFMTATLVEYMATRRSGSILVDGILGGDEWRRARRARGFTQRFPVQGARPTAETEFAILYDDDAVYVAIWAKDPEPHRITGLLTRRDQVSASDTVTVSIDSYRDRRTAFSFGLNPSNVQRDWITFDDSVTDDAWDAVWSGAASITGEGWEAEFRVPLSQLRFAAQESQRWGLQVTRVVARTGEEMSWSPWPRSEPQIVSRFGIVAGIEGVRPGRRIELLPYLTAGVASRPLVAGDTINEDVTGEGDIGIDAKYSLSSSFSIAATINPDFGQVEADPSQVNLTTNQLFLPEKRSFFLDGVELFKINFGQVDSSDETLFYSRRIGAPPHGTPAADYVRIPGSTAIYGAGKISGKTSTGWSLGLLDAVTAQEDVMFRDADGEERTQSVEPLTNFAVATLKRDFRAGKTTVSASATAVNRKLSDTGLRGELHDQAYSGEFAFQHRFLDDRISLSMKLLGSHVRGAREAIARTQQLPWHLFQRPDAGHLQLDPMRTSLSGSALVSSVEYRTRHWRVATGVDARTPGFEVNDAGFQNTADQSLQWGVLSYRDDDPGEVFLNYQVNGNVYSASDLEPRMLYVGGDLNGNGQLRNYWRLDGGVEVTRNRWDNTALRGGPSLRQDDRAAMWMLVESDSRKRLSLGIDSFLRMIPASATYQGDVGVLIKAQVASNVELVAEPSISIAEDDDQYFDQVEDAVGTTRYLVGRIRQVSASLTLRMSWTLTSRLSLQAYAQPFVATGGYESYKEVVNAGARRNAQRFEVLRLADYRVLDDAVLVDRDQDGVSEYSFDRPDFGFRDLRSTLVLRWEYRPGSSVFAIWSHGQSSFDDDGRFRLGSSLSRLGASESEDIVMVKATFWLGL